MTTSFTIDMTDLARLVAGIHNAPLDRELKVAVTKAVMAVYKAARDRVKVRSGATRQGIHMMFTDGGLGGWVGPTTVSGIVLELGSRPHVIAARNAQALRIPVHPNAEGRSSPFGGTYGRGGTLTKRGEPRSGPFGRAGAQVSFFKSVHHPGTKPQPFLAPAVAVAGPLIEAELLRVGQVVTRAMAAGL